MIIYGVALLSVSLIFGMLIGEALGVMLGVDANVGGVGIAMLFLVFASNSTSFKALIRALNDVELLAKTRNSMAMPTPPTLASTPNITPSASPMSMPKIRLTESKATP